MKQDKVSGIGRGRQPRVPVCVERYGGYGSVPGLEDKELADPAELERQVAHDEWGPILALPVYRGGSWIRPTIDEKGHYDWGAFSTQDFERLYGSFDKVRYKIDRLEEELQWAVIKFEAVARKVPKEMIFRLMRDLRGGAIAPDDIEDLDQYFFAVRYLRMRGLQDEIRELRRRRALRCAEAAVSEG